eukprot:gene45998-56296_t
MTSNFNIKNLRQSRHQQALEAQEELERDREERQDSDDDDASLPGPVYHQHKPNEQSSMVPSADAGPGKLMGSLEASGGVKAAGAASRTQAKAKTRIQNHGLRKGKWTAEEERYTMKVIEVFNAGLLQLTEEEQQGNKNITLRAYLANKLHCDPMRLTKKFSGSACLGKRVFHFDYLNAHAAAAEAARRELQELERQHHDKLREMGRK